MTIDSEASIVFTAHALLTGQIKQEIVRDLSDAGMSNDEAARMVQEMAELHKNLCQQVGFDRINEQLLAKAWPLRASVASIAAMADNPVSVAPAGSNVSDKAWSLGIYLLVVGAFVSFLFRLDILKIVGLCTLGTGYLLLHGVALSRLFQSFQREDKNPNAGVPLAAQTAEESTWPRVLVVAVICLLALLHVWFDNR